MPQTPRAATARVVVFGLGGTIAMATAPTGGVAPALTVEALVAAVPGLDDLDIDIDVVSFRSRPGASLSFSDLAELTAEVERCLAGGAAGAVVTQGTDTIEESAYLLDLHHRRPEPVVVTGAMRNPTLAGADGPANLLAAIRVAAAPAARGLGALVVFDDQIHLAARVRKTHSSSVSTFQSATGGPVGYLVEGTPIIVNRPSRRYTLPLAQTAAAPRVAVYPATFGDDGSLLATLATGLDGLVVAGFGVGHVPEPWVEPLTAIARRIPVVLATRTGTGPVLSHTYGFAGSERDLRQRGLVPAGLLDPWKARILLDALLGRDLERHQVAAAFAAAGGLGDPHAWPWPDNVDESVRAEAADLDA